MGVEIFKLEPVGVAEVKDLVQKICPYLSVAVRTCPNKWKFAAKPGMAFGRLRFRHS